MVVGLMGVEELHDVGEDDPPVPIESNAEKGSPGTTRSGERRRESTSAVSWRCLSSGHSKAPMNSDLSGEASWQEPWQASPDRRPIPPARHVPYEMKAQTGAREWFTRPFDLLAIEAVPTVHLRPGEARRAGVGHREKEPHEGFDDELSGAAKRTAITRQGVIRDRYPPRAR